MLRLIWRESAVADAEHIVSYVGEHDALAATKLREVLVDRAERLTEYPFMYRGGRVAGTREALVHPNYLLIYRVSADIVEVLRIIHTRQRYP